jgi:dTDP-4-dehydrorhamnose 3,5-epimerase
MNRLEFLPTSLAGLVVVQRSRIEDTRGFLSRLYSADAFAEAGVGKPIAQINQTLTRRRGAVRGMHFQWPPHAEAKLVTCVQGEVFDVAVDLRRHSPTFLRWHGETLSKSNQRSLLIPEGFAHGFQTLTGDCELLYLHTAPYAATAEGGISATEPRVSIAWPLDVAEMSDRDRGHPALPAAFDGIVL